MAQPLITVIGSLNADLIIRTSRIPSAGETLTSQSFDTGFGGKGANQATACARLSRRSDGVGSGNVDVKMVGMTGDDTFGRDIRWPMVSNGIDISDVWIKEGYKTGVAVVIVEEAIGENRIFLSPNANYALKPAQFTTIPGPMPDLLVLQLEIPLETVLKILEVASDKEIPVVLNPAPAQALPKKAYKAIRHLIVNESEAAMLSESMLSGKNESRIPRLADLPSLPNASSQTSTLPNSSRLPDTPTLSDTSVLSSDSMPSELATVQSEAQYLERSQASDVKGDSSSEIMNVSSLHILSNTPAEPASHSETASVKADAMVDSGPSLPQLILTAKLFHIFGVNIVIITLGARGVFISIRNGICFRFPAEEVDAVDTTAAGDTFVGAYAVAIAKYKTKELSANQILSAVKWANKCAAKTVEKEGAQSAIPWLDEVRPFAFEKIVYEAPADG